MRASLSKGIKPVKLKTQKTQKKKIKKQTEFEATAKSRRKTTVITIRRTNNKKKEKIKTSSWRSGITKERM